LPTLPEDNRCFTKEKFQFPNTKFQTIINTLVKAEVRVNRGDGSAGNILDCRVKTDNDNEKNVCHSRAGGNPYKSLQKPIFVQPQLKFQ
jgi:hypothetical protein